MTRHCCPEGHHLDNHCRDSTGIDFQLQTFDERLSPELQSARAAGKPADLVVVDTTSVDFNLLWMKAHKMDSRSLKEERHNATRLDLEAFLRRFLAVPHAPGLAFAETAWLDNSAMGRTGTKGEQFGAWIDHAPIFAPLRRASRRHARSSRGPGHARVPICTGHSREDAARAQVHVRRRAALV